MLEWKTKLLNISGITDDSIVDGPGLRYTIFVQGCPHHCPGCHNPQTHDFAGGEQRTLVSLMNDILENPLLSGVTFSGGEPFCQPEALALLGREVHAHGLQLMCYTGYTYEQLLERAKTETAVADLLAVTDILVDGPFLMQQRDLNLLFRGSSNQRLIDLGAMRKAGNMDEILLCQERELR